MAKIETMEEELLKLGFTENEAKIYLASLKFGPVSANFLAKHTGIKRATAYLALHNLVKQGLAVESYNNKKRLFVVEKPEKLEKITKRMRRKVIEAESLLEHLIPLMSQLPKESAQEPKVAFYNGMEGMRSIILEISSSKQSWYLFGSSSKILEKFLRLGGNDILEEGKIIRQNMVRPKIYFITDNGILSLKDGFEKIKTPWREMKILPKIISDSSGLVVFEDKLAIFSFEGEPFAAVIKSKEIMGVVKTMYKLIWSSLK